MWCAGGEVSGHDRREPQDESMGTNVFFLSGEEVSVAYALPSHRVRLISQDTSADTECSFR